MNEYQARLAAQVRRAVEQDAIDEISIALNAFVFGGSGDVRDLIYEDGKGLLHFVRSPSALLILSGEGVPSVRDSFGRHPIWYFARDGKLYLVTALLRNYRGRCSFVEWTRRDCEGVSPLVAAIRGGERASSLEILQMLVHVFMCDLYAIDENGNFEVLEAAMDTERGNVEVLQLIEQSHPFQAVMPSCLPEVWRYILRALREGKVEFLKAMRDKLFCRPPIAEQMPLILRLVFRQLVEDGDRDGLLATLKVFPGVALGRETLRICAALGSESMNRTVFEQHLETQPYSTFDYEYIRDAVLNGNVEGARGILQAAGQLVPEPRLLDILALCEEEIEGMFALVRGGSASFRELFRLCTFEQNYRGAGVALRKLEDPEAQLLDFLENVTVAALLALKHFVDKQLLVRLAWEKEEGRERNLRKLCDGLFTDFVLSVLDEELTPGSDLMRVVCSSTPVIEYRKNACRHLVAERDGVFITHAEVWMRQMPEEERALLFETAIHQGNLGAARLLMNPAGSPREREIFERAVEEQEPYGESELERAVRTGDAEAIRALATAESLRAHPSFRLNPVVIGAILSEENEDANLREILRSHEYRLAVLDAVTDWKVFFSSTERVLEVYGNIRRVVSLLGDHAEAVLRSFESAGDSRTQPEAVMHTELRVATRGETYVEAVNHVLTCAHLTEDAFYSARAYVSIAPILDLCALDRNLMILIASDSACPIPYWWWPPASTASSSRSD